MSIVRSIGFRPPALTGTYFTAESGFAAPGVSAPQDAYIPATKGPKLASARRGVLKHGEHLVDLVLDMVPGIETRDLPGFSKFSALVTRFVQEIETHEISQLNEKFDGSPAILLGFDGNGKPFVAYKGGIGGKRGPKIIRTIKEAGEVYAGAMKEIFEDCIRALRTQLKKFPHKDLVFQADLLFTPRNGAMEVTDEAVSIRANPFGITYTLPAGSKFYEFAARAQVGLVVHTVGRRVLNPNTNEVVGVESIADAEVIEDFVKTIRSEKVFAIDPWSRRVQIDRGEDTFTREKKQQILRILHDMQTSLATVSPLFRDEWKRFLPHFKIFLNASLKEGKSGGIYRAAAANEHFDFNYLFNEFGQWLVDRSNTLRISPKGAKRWLAPRTIAAKLKILQATNQSEIYICLKAYFDAIRIQYLLKPHMQEVYASKLGGGPIEGIMLTDDDVVVKLVDRLVFTMQNFSGEKTRKLVNRARRATPKKKEKPRMPQEFREYPASAIVYIGKFQPPHDGHKKLVHGAAAQVGAENILVVASTKKPDHYADHWKDLGIAARRKDLVEGAFIYVFSPQLREEMWRYALPEGARLVFADTATFYTYLARAKDKKSKGQIALLMGEKEMAEGRYANQLARYPDHLRAAPMPMQHDGISATMVRAAIRSLHRNGDFESYEFLQEAFAYISEKERDRIIGRLIKEWSQAEAAVARVL